MPYTVRLKNFTYPIDGKTLGDAVEGDLLTGRKTDLGCVQADLPPVHELAGHFQVCRLWAFAASVERPKRLNGRIESTVGEPRPIQSAVDYCQDVPVWSFENSFSIELADLTLRPIKAQHILKFVQRFEGRGHRAFSRVTIFVICNERNLGPQRKGF